MGDGRDAASDKLTSGAQAGLAKTCRLLAPGSDMS